jgi:tagatose-1,6-bisphosphate aldolase non-catalytic subunit AgaZ/GatZ
LRNGRWNGLQVLIEATANQVNQNGGYTGLTSAGFHAYVMGFAKEESIDSKQIILGGDHPGPLVWCNEDAKTAMHKADELVESYAAAGFTKLHLDMSMPLGGETRKSGFRTDLITQRSTRLFAAAEMVRKSFGISKQVVYVIRSEIPVAGGAVGEESVNVTKP